MPGALFIVGVHVKVLLTAVVPCAPGNVAPDGNPLADKLRVGAGIDESVARTVNVRAFVWIAVSVAGAVRTGGTWVPTLTPIHVVRVNEPLVPVTTTVKDPVSVGATAKVAVPEPLMLEVSSDAVIPDGVVRVSETVDPNPLRRLRLIVEVAWDPVLRDRLDGFADKLKSENEKVILVA